MAETSQENTTFKVRLVPQDPIDGPALVLHASPNIDENRNVNYKSLEPVHMPGAIHAYTNTSSRTFSVSDVRLFSRNREEATMNLARVNLLRSWTVGAFGTSKPVSQDRDIYRLLKLGDEDHYYGTKPTRSLQQDAWSRQNGGALALNPLTEDTLGKPPAVLLFSAYSNTRYRGNIFRIPTVITNVTIPYPNDVDYISTLDVDGAPGEPFPMLMNISIQLVEIHSPNEYEGFNLTDYKNGNLTGF